MDKLPLSEQAGLINDMIQTPGWKVFNQWLNEMFEITHVQLESADENTFRDLQGQLKVYRQIFIKIQEAIKLADNASK